MYRLVAAVALLALAVGVSADGTPCCAPDVPLYTFSEAYVDQNAQSPQLRNLVSITTFMDKTKMMSLTSIGNGTVQYEIYTDGNVKRSWVNILKGPGAGYCVNGTYNPSTFHDSQLCVGPGTQYPSFAIQTTLGGLMGDGGLTTESWGDDTNGNYINVNPKTCIPIGSSNPTGGNLQIMYNMAKTFDTSILQLPSNCPSGLNFAAMAAKNPAALVAVFNAEAVARAGADKSLTRFL